ncbi:MAG: ATP phosphoribosyltransferase, partial [Butyricicoccaceae bacterium]
IVDIVETGTTLKENGLEVYEDVAPISARVIVNVASMKMKKQNILRLTKLLEQALEAK